MGLRGVAGFDHEADVEPGAACDALPQTLRPTERAPQSAYPLGLYLRRHLSQAGELLTGKRWLPKALRLVERPVTETARRLGNSTFP